jgi:tripartite-type tricarboxylate transporter receptor subunit TctC
LSKVRRLSYGSSGVGAASHLAAELFKAMAQVDLLHVPYKGTGQALTDLLGGQIDLMFAPGQTVVSQIKSGKLRALATTGKKRSSTLPELPTVAGRGVREKMEAMGAEPAGDAPEEFARFVRDDQAKWSKLAPK